jgi:hypothetical protein
VTTVELRYTSIVQSEHGCVYRGIATVGLFKANERSTTENLDTFQALAILPCILPFSVVDPLNTGRKRHSTRKLN